VIECRQIFAKEDGWTEWQHPKQKGYLAQCCGCNLVHEVEFQVVRVVSVAKNGTKTVEAVRPDDFEVEFRVRRVE
jgi:hypothetical protein